MITSLNVSGFKSWKSSGDLRFGKLTGFFGTNSSGKTSLLQLLLMLKQTSESPDRSQVLHLGDDRTLVGLGVLRDVLYAHRANGELAWKLAWTLAPEAEPLAVEDPEHPRRKLVEARDVAFEARVAGNSDNGLGRLVEMSYGLGGYRFTYLRSPSRGTESPSNSSAATRSRLGV